MATLLIIILVVTVVYLLLKSRQHPQHNLEQIASIAEAQYRRHAESQIKGIDELTSKLAEHRRNKSPRGWSLETPKEIEEQLNEAKAWLKTMQHTKEMYVRLLAKFSSNREVTGHIVADWALYTQILDEIRSESDLADRYIEAGLDPFDDESIESFLERKQLQQAQMEEIGKKFKAMLA